MPDTNCYVILCHYGRRKKAILELIASRVAESVEVTVLPQIILTSDTNTGCIELAKNINKLSGVAQLADFTANAKGRIPRYFPIGTFLPPREDDPRETNWNISWGGSLAEIGELPLNMIHEFSHAEKSLRLSYKPSFRTNFIFRMWKVGDWQYLNIVRAHYDEARTKQKSVITMTADFKDCSNMQFGGLEDADWAKLCDQFDEVLAWKGSPAHIETFKIGVADGTCLITERIDEVSHDVLKTNLALAPKIIEDLSENLLRYLPPEWIDEER